MKLNPGDLVAIVHDETPLARSARTGEKDGRKDARQRRVVFFDQVESVASGKVKLKVDKEIDLSDEGIERDASKQKRKAKGEKDARAYRLRPGWLPVRGPFLHLGARIDLDEAFIQNVLIPNQN